MEITWLGHSAVRIRGSRTLFVDPFLSGNPTASLSTDQVAAAHGVVLTHDHGDHAGDALSICRATGAVLFAIYEITEWAAAAGVRCEGMNIGGTVAGDGFTVSLVPAFHSAGRGGTAAGAVIEMDGKRVYHAGDTGLTLEMQLIGEMYRPDVALLPIDGRYNMTPRLAAKAVELLGVPRVVPIHHGTFPALTGTPDEFRRLVGDRSQVVVLKPGESLEL